MALDFRLPALKAKQIPSASDTGLALYSGEGVGLNFFSRAYKLSIMIAHYIVRDYFVDS